MTRPGRWISLLPILALVPRLGPAGLGGRFGAVRVPLDLERGAGEPSVMQGFRHVQQNFIFAGMRAGGQK